MVNLRDEESVSTSNKHDDEDEDDEDEEGPKVHLFPQHCSACNCNWQEHKGKEAPNSKFFLAFGFLEWL